MKAAHGIALAALCVAYGNSWLVIQGWPSELPAAFTIFVHFVLLACVGFTVSIGSPRRWDDIRSSPTVLPVGALAKISVAGACFFVVPLVAVQLSAGAIAQSTLMQVFCAMPVLTVLAASHLKSSAQILSNARNLLIPSVAGLSGTLLLAGIYSPGSLRRWLFVGLLIASSALMALASVWIHELLQRMKIPQAIAAIGLTSALLAGAFAKDQGWPALTPGLVAHEILRGLAFDVPLTWLTVWLMRELNPVRLSARFLLAPFFYAVEYLALMRSMPSVPAVASLALMCTGGVLLLVRDESEEPTRLRLR